MKWNESITRHFSLYFPFYKITWNWFIRFHEFFGLDFFEFPSPLSILDYLPWNLILLRRLFSHQNQAIAKSSLVQFMKHFEINPSIFEKFCFHEFIQDSLLPSLNNPKFYDTNEIFDALNDYLLKMENDGNSWRNFVHSAMEISWAPIPLFHCAR